MAWNTPKTWAVGDILTASDVNTYVRDNTNFLNAPPSARVYNDAAISINNDTITALTFNSERWDTDTIHNTSTNTNRLTCQTAGLYLIHGHVRFASNNTGYRIAGIRLNGSTQIANQKTGATQGTTTVLSVSTVYLLTASDYVELVAYQDSGGALNVEAGGNLSPEFGMTYLGAV
jgi:hypothetical protein